MIPGVHQQAGFIGQNPTHHLQTYNLLYGIVPQWMEETNTESEGNGVSF